MELTIRYRGNTRFEATARGHVVTTDQPLDEGGSDSGMTPPELFLSALGTCVGHYAAVYLNLRHLPTAGLQVQIHALKSLNPARISTIQIDVTAGQLDQKHREGLQRAVDRCVLHNTLLFPPNVTIAVVTGCQAEEVVQSR